MKKITLLLLALVMTASFSSLKAGDNKIGVRAGWQQTMFMYDGNKVGDNLSGYYVGAFRDHQLVPLLRFSAGLELSQFGAEIEKEKMAITYLGIPLALKAKLGPISAIGGSGINFKIGESDGMDVNSIDIPVYLGAGFNILMIGIEGRYIWGLSDVADGIKNRGFQLGATIRF
ncbi:porin family protein [Labilibacter marinus]|uniref:outer membrane beta-barrel protein n=1 Tax=Labilibacter marinus TaxID=1477105 RepID=UPI00094FD388|nr:outer membrane beta-barrel protein [Labilibacter marinus]